MITNLNFATLYVSDQQRTLEFFVDKLGFEVRTDAEMSPGKRWLEVAPHGAETTLALLKAADFDLEPSPGLATMTFSCDNVHATYEQLRAVEAEVSEPVAEPWGTYIEVTDPDGYTLMVSQRA